MAEVRQLKIKTGSVLRLSKELTMYAAEQATETARVAKMRDDERDSHDIQHAVKNCISPFPYPNLSSASAAQHLPDFYSFLDGESIKQLVAIGSPHF